MICNLKKPYKSRIHTITYKMQSDTVVPDPNFNLKAYVLVSALSLAAISVCIARVSGFFVREGKKYYSTVASQLYWNGYIWVAGTVAMCALTLIAHFWPTFLPPHDSIPASLWGIFGALYMLYIFQLGFRWIADINGVGFFKGFLIYILGLISFSPFFILITVIYESEWYTTFGHYLIEVIQVL